MHKELHQGFSKFSWALALFCLPSALFPLALILSPQFSKNPQLTPFQVDLFSIIFWIYPAILALISALLFRLHKTKPALARKLLAASFLAFYVLMGYIISFFVS